MPTHIGTFTEKSLHAQLKQLYAAPGDLLEHPLDGYVVDIAQPLRSEAGSASPDYRCIEIQTRHLAAMKPKLAVLLAARPVHVVFPIAAQRTIARIDGGGAILSRRRSPKRGSIYDIFPELVSLPALIHHPHFSLEVLLIHEEQVWRDDGRGSWRRRRWSIFDRRLLATDTAVPLTGPEDFAALLPAGLADGFDCRTLAVAIGQSLPVAQKMAYCLRHMGILAVTGKQGNALLYTRQPNPAGVGFMFLAV
jgi:hypothetical protein